LTLRSAGSIRLADWPKSALLAVDNFFGDFSWSNPQANYGGSYEMWHKGPRFVVMYSPNICRAVVEELDSAWYRAAFQ
jgi:hypothetical protein